MYVGVGVCACTSVLWCMLALLSLWGLVMYGCIGARVGGRVGSVFVLVSGVVLVLVSGLGLGLVFVLVLGLGAGVRVMVGAHVHHGHQPNHYTNTGTNLTLTPARTPTQP